MISEDVILKKIQDGDIKTFKMFFESNYIHFYIYCRKYVSDVDDAKDILQNVFLNIWEKKDKNIIHTNFQSYVYRSIHNECLNFIRDKRSISFSEVDSDQSYEEKFVEESNPDSNLICCELERKTKQIINDLPDQCKCIFVLSRIEGKKNSDIADELGLSVRTVETQIYRALKVLKLKLKEYINS